MLKQEVTIHKHYTLKSAVIYFKYSVHLLTFRVLLGLLLCFYNVFLLIATIIVKLKLLLRIL